MLILIGSCMKNRSYAAAAWEPQTWFLLRHFYDFHHSMNLTVGGRERIIYGQLFSFSNFEWVVAASEWNGATSSLSPNEKNSNRGRLDDLSAARGRRRPQPNQTVCQAAAVGLSWQKSSAIHARTEDVSPRSQQLTSLTFPLPHARRVALMLRKAF